MFSFKKTHYFLACIALISVLAVAASPSKISSSFIPPLELSISELSSVQKNHAVLFNVNQVTNFNHQNQTSINYIFVVLMVVSWVVVVNFQFYIHPILPPPWNVALRYKSRLFVSGLKISNLQYKATLVSHI